MSNIEAGRNAHTKYKGCDAIWIIHWQSEINYLIGTSILIQAVHAIRERGVGEGEGLRFSRNYLDPYSHSHEHWIIEFSAMYVSRTSVHILFVNLCWESWRCQRWTAAASSLSLQNWIICRRHTIAACMCSTRARTTLLSAAAREYIKCRVQLYCLSVSPLISAQKVFCFQLWLAV